jgi:putative MATE family efflux protein
VRDFTKASVLRHLLITAGPIAVSLLAQIAYQLIDLYFITATGMAATAGVNAAANAIFLIGALAQVLSTGTVALVAHAAGRKDRADANLLFHQSMALSLACGLVMTLLILASTRWYLRTVTADEATIRAGATFMVWVLPGFVLSLPMAALSASLRGIGIAQVPTLIYVLTVLINAVLAPVLIAGWGTGAPFGVAGAGLATTLSVVIGLLAMSVCFGRLQNYLAVTVDLMRPKLREWWRILAIGLPAGTELALTLLSTAVIYYAIREFGASAQAGFGIGVRVLQTALSPGIAIAIAAVPIVGQNLGARFDDRVREAFRDTALVAAGVMLTLTVVVQWQPETLVRIFHADASATVTATVFLQLTSWALVAQALAYTCSTMFQGLGNTRPALLSSTLRFVVLAVLTPWLSKLDGFHIEQVWYVLIGSFVLQALVSLSLLRNEFSKRLQRPRIPVPAIGSRGMAE